MGSAGEQPFDRWDGFWSEYMVWSLRLSCYASDLYFFSSARAILHAALPPTAVSAALLLYSIACLWLIERLFARRYDPDYGHLRLTPAERRYRVGRERLIYSCAVFTGANLALGVAAGIVLRAPAASMNPMAYGLAGIIATFFTVFVGVICLVGRSGTTGRRMPLLYPLGIAAFLVPTLYVLLTARNELFPGRSAWW